MATQNLTNRFLNENKAYAEGVVATFPAILNEGGGRSQALPEYIQGGDLLQANVVEADTIIKRLYVIIDEAFPATATLTVKVGATTMATIADAAVEGITVSTTEDTLITDSTFVEAVVGVVTGDVTTGKARVVLDTVSPSLRNGQYAN